MRQVIVVGAGQAGQATVTKLRGEGFDGKIILIGDEPVPALSAPAPVKGLPAW